MKLELDLALMDEPAAEVLFVTLAAWRSARFGHKAQPTVVPNGGSAQAAVLSPAADAAVNQTPADATTSPAGVDVEKPQRKPRAAKNAEAPAAKPQQQPDGAAAAGDMQQPAASAPITIDELRAGLQRFTAEHGMPAGIELLKGFGCNRISELAEQGDEVKQKFLAKCPALAEAA